MENQRRSYIAEGFNGIEMRQQQKQLCTNLHHLTSVADVERAVTCGQITYYIFNYHRYKASTELNLRVGSPSNSSFFLPVRRIILLLPFGASMLCVSYSSSVRQFLSLFDATFFLLVSVYFDRKITPAYEITR